MGLFLMGFFQFFLLAFVETFLKRALALAEGLWLVAVTGSLQREENYYGDGDEPVVPSPPIASIVSVIISFFHESTPDLVVSVTRRCWIRRRDISARFRRPAPDNA